MDRTKWLPTWRPRPGGSCGDRRMLLTPWRTETWMLMFSAMVVEFNWRRMQRRGHWLFFAAEPMRRSTTLFKQTNMQHARATCNGQHAQHECEDSNQKSVRIVFHTSSHFQLACFLFSCRWNFPSLLPLNVLCVFRPCSTVTYGVFGAVQEPVTAQETSTQRVKPWMFGNKSFPLGREGGLNCIIKPPPESHISKESPNNPSLSVKLYRRPFL